MIWLYILIYFLGAIGTGLWVYTLAVKKYIKEDTALKFSVWIEAYDSTIFASALFWFIVLPIGIIFSLIKRIIKRINKHYNVEVMKLWKVRIKTYHFGIFYHVLYVLADTESNMLRTINSHPTVRKDEDAEVESYEEIDLTDETNRVL